MHIGKNKNAAAVKITALTTACLFFFSSLGFSASPARGVSDPSTLSPVSRFMHRTSEISLPGSNLEAEASIIYASRLIAKALETAESADNLRLELLKFLLRKHFGHLEDPGFDWKALSKDGKTFCLPLVRDRGKTSGFIRYYLAADDPEQARGKSYMSLLSGRTRLIYERAEGFSGAESQTGFLLNGSSESFPSEKRRGERYKIARPVRYPARKRPISEKTPQEKKASLNETQKIEIDREEDALSLLESFIRAIKKGKYQTGIKVDLRNIPEGTEVILVGDLHERIDNLYSILNHRKSDAESKPGKSNDSVLEKIRKGKAVLVILGDAIHADRNVGSNRSRSMASSLEMMREIMALKVAYPDHFYYVLGNHDDPDVPLYKIAPGKEPGEKIFVEQSDLYKNKLISAYGEEYLQRYRDLVDISPLHVVCDGLTALHAGPPEEEMLDRLDSLTYRDIVKIMEDGTLSSSAMLWGRYLKKAVSDKDDSEDARMLRAFGFSKRDINRYLKKIGQPDAFFVIAHSPHMIDGLGFYREFEKDRFVVYGAHDRTGYLSYTKGTLEAVDVSKERPVGFFRHKDSFFGSFFKKARKTMTAFKALMGKLKHTAFQNGALRFLPWSVLAGTVLAEAALISGSGQEFSIAGMVGLGAFLSSEKYGLSKEVKRSMEHIFKAAARSVRAANQNEDITRGLESRLEICPVDYLTDPKKVDLVAGPGDIAHVRQIEDRIKRGQVVSDDGRPIKINVRPGRKIEIWEGKHRLSALKRLGVENVPVHVVYFETELVGSYPFRSVSTGEAPLRSETKDSGQKEEFDHINAALLAVRSGETDPSRYGGTHSVSSEGRSLELTRQILSQSEGVDKWGLYVPTPVRAALKILEYVQTLKPNARMCDMGSGTGWLCFLAATLPQFRFSSVTGIEARENLHRQALRHKKEFDGLYGAENVKLMHGDFFEEDLSNYDVLYFFLTHPSSMKRTDFLDLLCEKMISPTGLAPGAKLVMLGAYDDVSDRPGLVTEKLKIAGEEIFVYSRVLKLKEEEPETAGRSFSENKQIDENPYGSEGNVSRRFCDLNTQYFSDISQEIQKRVSDYESGKRKSPVKVLLIGAGRGFEGFDILDQYEENVHLTITAKEDLLYRDPEKFIEILGGGVTREQAQRYVDRLLENYFRCDLDEGIHFEDNSFDIVMIDEFSLGYVKDKWYAMKEMMRVAKDGGVVYASPKEGYVELSGREVSFGEFFAHIEHAQIDSLTMTDFGKVPRKDRKGEHLKVLKTPEMALPQLEISGKEKLSVSARGRKIDVPVWKTRYVPKEDTETEKSKDAAKKDRPDFSRHLAEQLTDSFLLKKIESGDTEKKQIFFLSTSWIRDYTQNAVEYRDMNQLLSAIRIFFRERGMELFVTEDESIIGDIDRNMAKKENENSSIIVLAGEEKIRSGEFDRFKEQEDIFIAGISGKSSRVLPVIVLTIKLAFGQDSESLHLPEGIEWEYDPMSSNVLVISLPDVEQMDWRERIEKYQRQREFLIRA